MRNRTPLALLTLAGLLAMTAPTATALCADDGNGGCQALAAPGVSFDVRSTDCAESAGLCLADDGNASSILAGSDLHLNVTNHHGQAIDFEVFVMAGADDSVDDAARADRVRLDRIALIEDIAPGETRHAKLAVPGNASLLRFQALSADERHAELDVRALQVMYMTGLPGDGEGEVVGPADDDGHAADASGRDAPYLGIVAMVGVLAAIVGLRRFD